MISHNGIMKDLQSLWCSRLGSDLVKGNKGDGERLANTTLGQAATERCCCIAFSPHQKALDYLVAGWEDTKLKMIHGCQMMLFAPKLAVV